MTSGETADELSMARQILWAEASALKETGDRLGPGFERAVDLLDGAHGVIVTGLGKPGIIGSKIAATLASTGAAAHFVHAAEALHGDAGRLVRGNAMLALSFSGETLEVCEFANIAKERKNPIVAITGREESRLASLADAAIVIPVVREADPNGLAPTTSTTVMLGVGDALALLVMLRRGIKAEDFYENHRGGTLGHRLGRRFGA